MSVLSLCSFYADHISRIITNMKLSMLKISYNEFEENNCVFPDPGKLAVNGTAPAR